MMAFFYIIVSLVTFPLYLLLLFNVWLFRSIVLIGVKLRYWTRFFPLESADVFWTVGENHHNIINSILFLNNKNGENNIEKDIKMTIKNRILKQPDKYRKMLCSLNTFLGYPYLLRENVTADDVVNIVDVQNTKYVSLQDIVFAYNKKPMPRKNQLLWEILIIKAKDDWKGNNNLKTHQIPIFVRINHTLADSGCIMNLFCQTFGENINYNQNFKELDHIPFSNTFQNAFLFFIVPGYLIVESIKRELNKFNGPLTSYKYNIAYKTETNNECLLETIKNMKKDIGNTSYSEIILTVISATLFGHFQKNYYEIPGSLPLALAAVTDMGPINKNGVPQLKNRIGLVNVEMPISIQSGSMLDRLELIGKNTKNIMKTPDLMIRNYINFNLMLYFPKFIIQHVFPLNGVWGCISNLQDFPKIVIFNGYEVQDSYFFLVQRDQMATGFSIMHYDNRLHFGLISDTASICTKQDCDEIVKNIFKNIELLRIEVEKKKISLF